MLEQSDIIPQIDTLATRYMNHQFAYNSIRFPKYDMSPTYMPFQWMPYIIPLYFHFDERLFATILYLLSFLVIAFFAFRKIANPNNRLLLGLLLAILVSIPMLLFTNFFIITTVEQGIAAVYMLIPIFLIQKKYWITSLIIGVCLLSRYSIVFWVPLYLIVLFLQNKKMAIAHGALLLSMIIVFYVFPFFSHDTSIFQNGYNYHSVAALEEWKNINIPEHKNFQLIDGQGMAIFFCKMNWLPIELRLKILQKTHLLLSFLSVLISFVFYYKNRKKINIEIFLMVSLVFYLVVFYNFIQIPYKYLFITPFTVSVTTLISLALVLQKKIR